METRENIDIKSKSSVKIRWIIAALLLALWSHNFLYSQENGSLNRENDSLKKDSKYEQIEFIKMDSYVKFWEIEHTREKTIKYRNNIFQMLYQLFNEDDRFWFPEFYDISDEVMSSLEWIENEENAILILNNLKKQLEYDINMEKSVECRKALAKALSILKDKINIINWIPSDPIELLKKNLEVWDVILINKNLKDFDIWSDALKFFDDKYLTDFTHVLIFIWFDENWNIMVRHSTTETERLHKIWVEETSFLSYLLDPDRCNANWCDVVVLKPIPEIRQSILNFSMEKIWCWYDNRAALRQWLWKKNNFNNKYNCAEIVTQWIQMTEYVNNHEYNMSFKWKLYENFCEEYHDYLRNVLIPEFRTKTFPNDFFEYLELFKLKYICTL